MPIFALWHNLSGKYQRRKFVKNSARLLNSRIIRTPFFTGSAVVGAALFIAALLLSTKALSGNIVDGFIFVTSGEGWPDTPTVTATADAERTILVLRGLSIVVTAFGLIISWLPMLWAGIRCRYFDNNHTVICGLGWQGRAYAYADTSLPHKTVAVELNESPETISFCAEHKIHRIHGAADQTATLKEAGVIRAKQLFICTGNQDLNLQVASTVKEVVEFRNPDLDPLNVYVSMGASLADNASSDEMFSELLDSNGKAHFNFYDPEQRMARIFYYQYPVYKWAQEQYRPNGQPVRVHLVFLGFNRLAGELILQYSRIWPCLQHQLPLFTIIVPDGSRAQRFVNRHNNIYTDPPEGLESLADVNIEPVDANEVQLLNENLITSVSKKAPVTAVICCDDDAENNLQRASHCRYLCRKLDCWHVPVLVNIDKREGTDELLELSKKQINPADRILPFGSATDYCDLELIEYMNNWARAIHRGYTGTAVEIDSTLPAITPWESLRHIDLASNQRATDHLPVKLYTTGFVWCTSQPWPFYHPQPSGVETLKNLYNAKSEDLKNLLPDDISRPDSKRGCQTKQLAPFTANTLRELSRLEHRSWLNEHRDKRLYQRTTR